MLTRSLGVLFLAATLPAQLLPEPRLYPSVHAVSLIGERARQDGFAAGDAQKLVAYCDPADARGGGIGLGGVRLGGSVYWASGCSQYAPGSGALAFFAVAPWDIGFAALMHGLPATLAALDHEVLFANPALALLVAPSHQYLGLAGGFHDAWVIRLDVPPLPALIGSQWVAQSFRIDQGNSLLYLSDAIAVEIRP
jgi:hypothetical protein